MVVASDDDEIISGDINLNGLLRRVIIVTPDLDDTDTVTLRIMDADGYTVFVRATIAESVTTIFEADSNNHPIRAPVSGVNTITIKASGAQAANRTFTVVLYIERG